jgi:hypothetical protein
MPEILETAMSGTPPSVQIQDIFQIMLTNAPKIADAPVSAKAIQDQVPDEDYEEGPPMSEAEMDLVYANMFASQATEPRNYKIHLLLDDEPFQVYTMLIRDNQKLEWMQGDELKQIVTEEQLPEFAALYTDLFGTAIRSVKDRYQSIFAVFKLHMATMKKVFNITQRAQLSPEINEKLVLAVEKKVIKLCRECAKVIPNGLYCSTPCKTAALKIQCENCGHDKIEQIPGTVMYSCKKCGVPVATAYSSSSSRILNPEELIVNPDHEPAWKQRRRAA